MSVSSACRLVDDGTLSAAVDQVIEIETFGAKTIGVVLKNTGGTNAIDTITITKSPLGGLYGTDVALGTAMGSIDPGLSGLSQISASGFAFVRITLNSTSGTTWAIEAQGVH